MAEFVVPEVLENPFGWGPMQYDFPKHLNLMPYSPFNPFGRNERLERVTDWVANAAKGIQVAEEDEETTATTATTATTEEAAEEEANAGEFSYIEERTVRVKSKNPFSVTHVSFRNNAGGGGGGGGYYRGQRSNMNNNNNSNNNNNNNNSNNNNNNNNRGPNNIGGQGGNGAFNAANQGGAQGGQGGAQGGQGGSQTSATSAATRAMLTASSAGGLHAWGARAKQASEQQSSGAKQAVNQAQAMALAHAQAAQQRSQQARRRPFFEHKDRRSASVRVEETWSLVQDIELADLTGLTFEPKEEEDVCFAGELYPFDAKYSRVLPRNPCSLQRFDNLHYVSASTSEDPILTDIAQSMQAAPETKGTIVFATDSILSQLMASPRTVFSWDVLMRKENGRVVFDKRPHSRIDYLTVNENHPDVFHIYDRDNINHASMLSQEATAVNQYFSQQVLNLKGEKIAFNKPSPFIASLPAGSELAAAGFRYRRWDLGDDVQLVARTTLNGYTEKKTVDEDGDVEVEQQYVLTRVLNEFDPKVMNGVEWRQKLESQMGAVLAVEMKNNGAKLARFCAEAMLSGADELRLGFVSRTNPRNQYSHQVLLAKTFSVGMFNESIALKPRNLWGTFRVLLSKLLKLDDGEYVLLRDPVKNQLHVYAVPKDAFAHEAEQTEGVVDEVAE